jgi:hypothetical protein
MSVHCRALCVLLEVWLFLSHCTMQKTAMNMNYCVAKLLFMSCQIISLFFFYKWIKYKKSAALGSLYPNTCAIQSTSVPILSCTAPMFSMFSRLDISVILCYIYIYFVYFTESYKFIFGIVVLRAIDTNCVLSLSIMTINPLKPNGYYMHHLI